MGGWLSTTILPSVPCAVSRSVARIISSPGSSAGCHRAAALYSLTETATLNGLDPQLYLTDVLIRIADHPARQIVGLLPLHWQPAGLNRAAA